MVIGRENMESIYYVMTWLCHRRCVHCYEDRFRPYVRGALDEIVEESVANSSRIIANLPDTMIYRNLCIGRDRFHEQVLGPVLNEFCQQRLARRAAA
jgi:hypothetical protein